MGKWDAEVHRAVEEGALLAELRHPNVVMFYGVAFQETDTRGMSPLVAQHAAPFKSISLVTELCEGGALNEAELGLESVESGVLLDILAQVAAGMQVAVSERLSLLLASCFSSFSSFSSFSFASFCLSLLFGVFC